MSILEHKHVSEIEAAPPRRVEIFTGAGRRRTWTAEEKASIVAESYEEGVHACQVARRHGLTPQQLFTWRRAARESLKAVDAEAPSAFVPAVVEATAVKATPAEPADAQAASVRPPIIELEIGGSSVWIWRGAEAALVTAIVGALKDDKRSDCA